MKSLFSTTAVMSLIVGSTAFAGGIDRSGQSITLLFEEGNVAEFGLAYVMPNVSDDISGVEMAPDYFMLSGGVKMDYGAISAALIFDQPYGALVDYVAGPYAGINADLQTNAITALVGYDVTPNIMVYGGVTAQMTTATATLPGALIDVSSGTGWGFVAGAAYQIPEYALRVSLTYRSEITSENPTTINLGATPDSLFTTPQSINLEAQTGINEKTLIFGSVRWANWEAISIVAGQSLLLVDYTQDTFTYELGVGRKFTDTLSGALSVGYEASDGEIASVLSPTDGRTSIGAALIYTMGTTEVTAGLRYTWLGDTIALPGVTFSDNTALAAGVSVKYSF